MCGIVGYAGPQRASELLFAGLRTLEYRGYDSAGVATAAENGSISIQKRAGKLDNLQVALPLLPTDAIAGIAHTRWATHGEASDANAHPHSDESGGIALVHNGIIENFSELKRELEAAGHHFSSTTDTEVLVHLIESAYQGDLRAAIFAVLPKLRGQWAIAVMHKDEPGRIVAARKEAPLVIGIGDGEQFVASDPIAIAAHTRRIVFLRDGEVADLTKSGAQLFAADGSEVPLRIEEVTTSASTNEKGEYTHFMQKEMAEQPQSLRAAMLGRVTGGTVRIEELDAISASIAGIRSIEFVACGSAYNASLAAASLAERLFGIPARSSVASEFRYDPPALGPTTLIIAISQSGETADTLGAVRAARNASAPVIAIVNSEGSTLTRNADAVVLLRAGVEVSVAATKSFTSQALTALLVVLDLARRAGHLSESDAADWSKELLEIPEMASSALTASEGMRAIAARFYGSEGFMFTSRGEGFATALEGALKLKELSYLHAEGIPAGEMKHGPISLLGPKHPVVAVALNSHTLQKLISNLMEARARLSPVIAVVSGIDEAGEFADETIVIPAARPEIAALIASIPLQRFAYEMALCAGASVDQPKNLAKSVTVE